MTNDNIDNLVKMAAVRAAQAWLKQKEKELAVAEKNILKSQQELSWAIQEQTALLNGQAVSLRRRSGTACVLASYNVESKKVAVKAAIELANIARSRVDDARDRLLKYERAADAAQEDATQQE